MTERATECQSEPGRQPRFVREVRQDPAVLIAFALWAWGLSALEWAPRHDPTSWWNCVGGVLILVMFAWWGVQVYRALLRWHGRHCPLCQARAMSMRPPLADQVRGAVATPWWERRRRHTHRAG